MKGSVSVIPFPQKPIKYKMGENYSLSWDNFQSGASETFKNLIDDKDFLDVTLACADGSSVKAHKVILSSASSVLRTILIQNPHQHPLLYMKGIRQKNLQSILNFIYQGEVEIAQEDLNGFIEAAVELNIRGLNNVHQKDTEEREVNKTSNITKDEMLDVEIIDSKEEEESKTELSKMVYKENKTEFVGSSDHKPKKFVCDKCNYSTANSGHLKKHKLGIHEGIRYSCDQCESKFTTSDNLKTHTNMKHGRNVYNCKICHASFDIASKLKVHSSKCSKQKINIG